MKIGAAALVVGLPLLFLGVFLIGDRSGRINFVSYVAGLALIAFAVARLIWLGWKGSTWSWVVVAIPAAVLTWTLYELIRQTPPYPPIGVLGTYTAPFLSTAVGIGLIGVGWARHRSRDIRKR